MENIPQDSVVILLKNKEKVCAFIIRSVCLTSRQVWFFPCASSYHRLASCFALEF